MSDPTIDIALNQKFYRDYILLSQQMTSRLEMTVRQDPENLDAKYGYFNRIGATEMKQRTNRHADTPLVNTPHSKRRVGLAFFEWADLIDREDAQRVIANPQNSYVRNATAASRRKKDDIIIAAMRGNAYSVDADDVATAVPLPAGQKVAVNAEGLTLAKLLSTKEILDAAEPDENDPRYCAVTTKQVTNLLNTTEVKDADYNSVKALVEGKIDTFLGFKFIRTERLIKSGTTRYCLAWLASGVGLAVAEDLYTDIGPRRDKSNSTQVYVSQHMGATRIEDTKVVEIAASEA